MKSLSWDISKMHQNYAENLHRRANATQTSISFHTSDLPALPVLTSWVWLTAPVLPHFSWQGVSHPTHPGQKGECKVTAMKSLAVSGMRTLHHTEEWKPIFSLTGRRVSCVSCDGTASYWQVSFLQFCQKYKLEQRHFDNISTVAI